MIRVHSISSTDNYHIKKGQHSRKNSAGFSCTFEHLRGKNTVALIHYIYCRNSKNTYFFDFLENSYLICVNSKFKRLLCDPGLSDGRIRRTEKIFVLLQEEMIKSEFYFHAKLVVFSSIWRTQKWTKNDKFHKNEKTLKPKKKQTVTLNKRYTNPFSSNGSCSSSLSLSTSSFSLSSSSSSSFPFSLTRASSSTSS